MPGTGQSRCHKKLDTARCTICGLVDGVDVLHVPQPNRADCDWRERRPGLGVARQLRQLFTLRHRERRESGIVSGVSVRDHRGGQILGRLSQSGGSDAIGADSNESPARSALGPVHFEE